jgi:hypothetical protein
MAGAGQDPHTAHENGIRKATPAAAQNKHNHLDLIMI